MLKLLITCLILARADSSSVTLTKQPPSCGNSSWREQASRVCTSVHVAGKGLQRLCSNQHLQGIVDVPKNRNTPVRTYHLNMSYNDVTCFTRKSILRLGRSLKVLDLSHNRLSTLPDNLTYHLNHTTHWYFSYNNISNISSTAFAISRERVRRMQMVDLSHNLLSDLPSSVFHAFENLRTLDLSYNQLVTVSEDVFRPFTMLKHLLLGHNMLSHFPNITIAQLSKLDLANNQFTSVESLPLYTTVLYLDLSYNRITTISSVFFYNNFPNLRHLYLGGNAFTTLDINADFSRGQSRSTALFELATLSFSDWNLTRHVPKPAASHSSAISQDSTANSASLHNPIDSRPSRWKFLEQFRRSRHGRSAIAAGSLTGSSGSSSSNTNPISVTGTQSDSKDSTRELNLVLATFLRPMRLSFAGCGITSLGDLNQLDGSGSLERKYFLDVSRNNLWPDVMNGSFSLRWKTLKHLHMAETGLQDVNFLRNAPNKLNVLNLANNAISAGSLIVLGRFIELEDLYLSGNNLSTLPATMLHNISTLETVDLSQNRIHTLPDGVFDLNKMTQLRVLKLNKNNLTSISERIFYDGAIASNPSTRVLDLSDNYLAELPGDLLKGMPNLEEFYADRNQITTLGADLLAHKSLYILSLKDNSIADLPHNLFYGFWPTNQSVNSTVRKHTRYSGYLERIDFSGNPLNANTSVCPLAVLVEKVERLFPSRQHYTRNTILRYFDDSQRNVSDALMTSLLSYPCREAGDGVRPILSCNSQGKQVCLVGTELGGPSRSVQACLGSCTTYPLCSVELGGGTFGCQCDYTTAPQQTVTCQTWQPATQAVTSPTPSTTQSHQTPVEIISDGAKEAASTAQASRTVPVSP
eukprot:scpid87187/ scgid7081/ Chaoptin; Photoreceptor cell-specific membrane protein